MSKWDKTKKQLSIYTGKILNEPRSKNNVRFSLDSATMIAEKLLLF